LVGDGFIFVERDFPTSEKKLFKSSHCFWHYESSKSLFYDLQKRMTSKKVTSKNKRKKNDCTSFHVGAFFQIKALAASFFPDSSKVTQKIL